MWHAIHLIAIAVFFYTTIGILADFVTGLRYPQVYQDNGDALALSATILIFLLTWGEL